MNLPAVKIAGADDTSSVDDDEDRSTTTSSGSSYQASEESHYARVSDVGGAEVESLEMASDGNLDQEGEELGDFLSRYFRSNDSCHLPQGHEDVAAAVDPLYLL